jgi:hypothetical protein
MIGFFGELEKIRKETVTACFDACWAYCPAIHVRDQGKPQNTSVRIVGVSAEI